MKKIFATLTAIVLAVAPLAAQDNRHRVTVTEPMIEKSGDQVTVTFRAEVGRKVAKRNYSLVLAPALTDDIYVWALPAIVVEGRGANISRDRAQLGGFRNEAFDNAVVTRNNRAVEYRATIPYQLWMEGGRLTMESIVVGCCSTSVLVSETMADQLVLQPRRNEEPRTVVVKEEVVREVPVYIPVTTAEKLAENHPYILPYSQFETVEPGALYDDDRDTSIAVYYPVDFTRARDAETGKTDFMPLLRNHRYVVNIQQVDGPGHGETGFTGYLAFASASELSNLRTNILSYDEGRGGKVFYNGQYFMAFDAIEQTATREAQVVRFNMYTDYPYGGTMSVVNPNVNNWLGFKNGDSFVSQKGFNAHSIGDGNELIEIRMTAYTGAGQRQAQICVEVADLTVMLTVTQTKDTGYYIRLTDENGDEITALNFNYYVGLDEVPPQRVYVTWNMPADCTVTETPNATYPFVHAVESPADGAPVSGGAAWFDIRPEVVSEEDAEADPFRLMSSVLTFTSTYGGNVLSCDLALNQRTDFASVTQTLSVTGPATFSYWGGSKDYSVTSNITGVMNDGNIIVHPVMWSAQFSTDGGTTWTDDAPEWLTGFTTNGTGGAATTYAATTAAFPGTTTSAQDLALRSEYPKGSAATPYDLATGNTRVLEDMNTANCYIINAPGHYRLPLVYGNAIKDGDDNAQAYNPTGTWSSTFLTPFVNHLNAGITDPYLYNNAGVAPYDATLVWMDWPELISNVTLDENEEYLVFEIPQATIGQGNAIVAVRDEEGTILWSWHIWVTPLVPMNRPTTQAEIDTMTDATVNYGTDGTDGKTYNFMKYNLGWCMSRTMQHGTAPRSVQVRVTQTNTTNPASKTFTITQNHGTATTGNNNPYWQWGRKDPIPPSTGSGNTNKTLYGEYKYGTFAGQVSINMAILNPNKHCTFGGNWFSSNYYNLWSAESNVATANDNTVTKTVYDPSPAGFVMPAPNAGTGFTVSGGNVTSGVSTTNCNISGSFSNGWYFYLDSNKNEVAYYPAVGWRYNTNGVLAELTTGLQENMAIQGEAAHLDFQEPR